MAKKITPGGLFNLLLLTVMVILLSVFIFTTKRQMLQMAQDNLVKSQVETTMSFLTTLEGKVKKGELSRYQAKKIAADVLRDARYGRDGEGYFWVDTTAGVNVVLPTKLEIEGKNRLEDEIKGVFYVKKLIAQAQAGGGYVDYYYPKPEETVPAAKRGYVLLFEPWDWVIGSGYYLNDIK